MCYSKFLIEHPIKAKVIGFQDATATTQPVLILQYINSGSDGTDTLSNIEIIRFSDQDFDITPSGLNLTGTTSNDTLSGDSGDDLISGEEGNDNLTGLTGDDEIYGGDGGDDIRIQAGNSKIDGGLGWDTLEIDDKTSNYVTVTFTDGENGVVQGYDSDGVELYISEFESINRIVQVKLHLSKDSQKKLPA